MSYTTPNFIHPIMLLLALSSIASFTTHQVAARHILQMNYQDPAPQTNFHDPAPQTNYHDSAPQMNFHDPAPQYGTPTQDSPSLNKSPGALNFPAFQEPLLPPHFLPLLPFPSMPTIPSLPLPTGPSIPSFPTAPIPGFPSNVPPAFPVQPAKITSEDLERTPSMMKP